MTNRQMIDRIIKLETTVADLSATIAEIRDVVMETVGVERTETFGTPIAQMTDAEIEAALGHAED